MLNLVHVRSFLAVLEAKGVRPAAKLLGVAPSTIVDHIRQLEADLAAQLLVRRHGATVPTPKGARFVPFARALVSTATRAKELLRPDVLRVAAGSNVGTYLLQPCLAAFQQETRTDVEVWLGPNPDVAERLARGEADVAAMEWWDGRPGFRSQLWFRESLLVIVPPAHRWASRRSLEVEELADEPMLGGEPGTGTGRVLRAQLGPVADRLKMISGFGSTEAVKRAVRAGRGASIVMKSAVADEVASGVLVGLPIDGRELTKDIQLIVPEHLPSTALAVAFLKQCWSPASDQRPQRPTTLV